MDEREAANRAAREYLNRVKEQLAEGQIEIERQRASVDETRDHMTGMGKWIVEQGGVRPMPSDE